MNIEKEPTRLNAPQPRAARSREDVILAIQSFSDADWARLRLVAKKYAYCHTQSPDDLLHEALLSAIETSGGRRCPLDVDVVRFLAEAMRSIANGEKKKIHLRDHESLDVEGHEIDPPDTADDPEETLLAKQSEAQILHAALAPFEDDPHARDIIEGTLAGLNGEELRQLTGLSQTDYDSKRRLVRRRINKSYQSKEARNG